MKRTSIEILTRFSSWNALARMCGALEHYLFSALGAVVARL
jgi:hypothetical protein